MLDGLVDEEVEWSLEEHPRIVPLFEVDVVEAVTPYIVQPEEVGDDVGIASSLGIPGMGNGSVAIGESEPRNRGGIETGKCGENERWWHY